jgi:hypothetical protein
MAMTNPQTSAQLWSQNLANARTKMTQGVANPKRDPIQAAIAAKPKMQANFNTAMQQGGTYDKAMQQTSQATWQAGMTNTGIPRVIQAATSQTAISHVQTFLTAASAYYAQVRQTIGAMPNTSDADGTARMTKNLELMRQMKGMFKGRRNA